MGKVYGILAMYSLGAFFAACLIPIALVIVVPLLILMWIGLLGYAILMFFTGE
jgi:hypothetical protein